MNWCEKSDGELVAAFTSAGAHAAFEELVRRHATMVFRTCRRVTGSHQDAEDATQTVFATLVLKGSNLSSHPSLAGWLYSAAWHVSRRYRRAELTRRQREQRAQPVIPLEAGELAADDDTVGQLYRALEMLPADYRDALVLHHLEELTVGEVATVLGCSVGTIAARLSRGRAMVRERLSWRGIVMADVTMTGMIAAEMTRDAASETLTRRLATAAALRSEAASAGVIATSTAAVGGAVGVGRPAVAGIGVPAMTTYAGLTLSRWAAVACASASLSATAVAIVSSNPVRQRITGSHTETRVNRSAGAEDDDYRIVSSSPSPRSTSVPEPAGVALLSVAGLLMRRTRRQHRSG